MGHLSIARAVQFAAASVDSDVAGWDSLDRGSVSGAAGSVLNKSDMTTGDPLHSTREQRAAASEIALLLR
jgi:hypothetical protein